MPISENYQIKLDLVKERMYYEDFLAARLGARKLKEAQLMSDDELRTKIEDIQNKIKDRLK